MPVVPLVIPEGMVKGVVGAEMVSTTPVPFKGTKIAGPPGVSRVKRNAADFSPSDSGWKEATRLHFPLGDKVDEGPGQLVDTILNIEASAPTRSMDSIPILAEPLFVRVKVCAGEVVGAITFPKL